MRVASSAAAAASSCGSAGARGRRLEPLVEGVEKGGRRRRCEGWWSALNRTFREPAIREILKMTVRALRPVARRGGPSFGGDDDAW